MGYNSADKTDKQYISLGVGFAAVLDSNVFKLSNIKVSDGCWDTSSDILQVLNNTSAGVIAKYVYWGEWEDADPDAGEVGWWDDEIENQLNDDPVNPGDAWLGNFAAKDVKIAFPGALD